jgi:hypothetical protein
MRYRLIAIAIFVGLSAHAHAELGAAPTTYAQAAYSSQNLANCRTSIYTLTNGVVITEFVNAQEQVFAVQWSGPMRPDLGVLLGKYFFEFQSQMSKMRSLHGGAHYESSTFVMGVFGHMGKSNGFAYLPPLLPVNFDLTAFQ